MLYIYIVFVSLCPSNFYVIVQFSCFLIIMNNCQNSFFLTGELLILYIYIYIYIYSLMETLAYCKSRRRSPLGYGKVDLSKVNITWFLALAGNWTLAAEFVFHMEYHYTTDPQWFCLSFFFCGTPCVRSLEIGHSIIISRYLHRNILLLGSNTTSRRRRESTWRCSPST